MAVVSRTTLLGYGLMLTYVVLFSLSAAAVQALERTVPDFQLGIFRYVVGVLLTLFPIYGSGLSLKLPNELVWYVFCLALCSMTYNGLFYFAVSVLPLSHASSLSYVSQTVVMVIVSIVLLHEKGSLVVYTAVFGCILGMLLLLQPWSDFNQGFTPGFAESISQENNTVTLRNISPVDTPVAISHPNDHMILGIGYLAVVITGGIEVYTIILVSNYLNGINPIVNVFYAALLCVLPNVLCSFYLEQPVMISDPYTIILILAHALALALGLMALNRACQLISPVQVAITLNFGLVVSVILQYTLLSGHLYGRRNILEVAGCLLVTLSITLSAVSNEKNHEDFNP